MRLSRPHRIIGGMEDALLRPSAEGLGVAELLERLGVIGEQGGHSAFEGPVMLESCLLLVGVDDGRVGICGGPVEEEDYVLSAEEPGVEESRDLERADRISALTGSECYSSDARTDTCS